MTLTQVYILDSLFHLFKCFSSQIKLKKNALIFFNDIKQTTGVGKELLIILVKENLDIPCTDFDKAFLLKLFIRMRIHYSLKYVNRELVATKRKNRMYIKIVHFS